MAMSGISHTKLDITIAVYWDVKQQTNQNVQVDLQTMQTLFRGAV